MTSSSPTVLARIALEQIAAAFSNRPQPEVMTDSFQLSDAEYEEVMAFQGLDWRDVDMEMTRRNADAVFWFAPQAFCYYLPGLLTAGLRDGKTDSNAYDALLGMLDRTPDPALWDDFFAPRWTLLSPAELAAVDAWVAWFAAIEPESFPTNTLERVRDTLALLARTP